MKSILKFWDQNTGIKINGIPLENIENHSLRKQMSFYSQNVPIITGSFYDNLNFGRRKMEPEVYQNIRFLDKFTKERDIFTPFILEMATICPAVINKESHWLECIPRRQRF